MIFWHNNRYQEQEEKLLGDKRALPGQAFPWVLNHFFFKDYEDHRWEMRIICENISPPISQKKILASVLFSATLVFNKEMLRELAMNADRLFALELSGWNMLHEEMTKRIECDLEGVKDRAMELCEGFVSIIATKYTPDLKKDILLENIKKSTVSKFSA